MQSYACTSTWVQGYTVLWRQCMFCTEAKKLQIKAIKLNNAHYYCQNSILFWQCCRETPPPLPPPFSRCWFHQVRECPNHKFKTGAFGRNYVLRWRVGRTWELCCWKLTYASSDWASSCSANCSIAPLAPCFGAWLNVASRKKAASTSSSLACLCAFPWYGHTFCYEALQCFPVSPSPQTLLVQILVSSAVKIVAP